MPRPVWFFELVRDTDAPLALVAEQLERGEDFHRWHPRLKRVCFRVEHCDGERFEGGYEVRHAYGVVEEGHFRLWIESGRTVLQHRVCFKGWPVLLLMGWWRVRSHRMWERFVGAL